MDLGTILVVIGLVLAVVAAFVGPTVPSVNGFRLLCAAVVLVAVGVLVGAAGLHLR